VAKTRRLKPGAIRTKPACAGSRVQFNNLPVAAIRESPVNQKPVFQLHLIPIYNIKKTNYNLPVAAIRESPVNQKPGF
jgi:hypothetical protein